LLLLALGVIAGALAYLERAQPDWWARQRYPLEYEQIVVGHARHYHLDPALLAAVIYQESSFRPDVRSPSGAIGLMQLLPNTAEGIALRTGGTRFRTADLYNPEINIRYGAWYLRHLIGKYDNERLALAAYNAGQASVDDWVEHDQGILFKETRAYVDRVEHLRVSYRKAYPVLRGGAR